MSLLKIVTWPNPILDAPGEPVTKFDGDLKKLVNNMFETMYSAQRIVMINPEVVGIEGKQDGDEGCLSFPGIFFSVQRNLRAIVRAHDINGEEFELDGTELTARCMLHETDHCDGIVFLDKMTPLKREIVKRRIKKLQKAGEWPS